jgi:L-ascorbate metabolism protein UlaG (beta-lactamase superfamily)
MNCKITFVGTATMLIEVGKIRILTDPVFDPVGTSHQVGRGGAMKYTSRIGPAVKPEDIGGIDLVLLSHDHHGDNLDESGRKLLPLAKKIFTTRSGAKRLRKRLGDRLVGMSPWESAEIKTEDGFILKITAAPARHGPAFFGFLAGEVIGFILEWPGQKNGAVYISGDTRWCHLTREIPRRFKVGTSILHIGKAQFKATLSVQYTMDAFEGAQAAKELKSERIIPIHYEGWSHFQEGREDIEATFREEGLAEKLQWLPLGKPLILEP